MIDLHCHLLPNIDDGPKSWEESINMVRIAAQDGIKGAVTTPHWIEGTNWLPRSDTVRELVRELNTKIKENGIEFTVYPGMEVGISPNLAALISSGDILTLGEGDYLLMEMPYYSLPLGIEEIIEEIISINKCVILAHPERNKELQSKPKRILDLLNLGALSQVTAGSLSGDFGGSVKKCALGFAAMSAIHFVSSDGHSTKHRSPLVSLGLKALEKAVGGKAVRKIVDDSYGVVGLRPPE